MRIRRTLIRKIVGDLLEENMVFAPPVPVERLLQSKNVSVRKSARADDTSGFVIKAPHIGAVIGVNSHQAPTRQRFTMAHELGHLLLHDFDDVHVDNRFLVTMKMRDDESSRGEKIEEVEANLFAAEVLMPKRFLDQDVAKLQQFDLLDEEHLKDLAEKYQVSPQALTIRLGYLGYLPKE